MNDRMRFRYVGRSSTGTRLTGEVAAGSRVEAIQLLDGRSVSLVSLESATSATASYDALLAGAVYLWHGLRLRPALLTLFRQLALFEKHGVPIERSLGLCMASCSNARLREALRGVLADVSDRGWSLRDALAARPGEFTPMMVAMVGAAEEGAGLAQVVGRIALLLERGKRVYGKVQRALYYPAAVLLGVIGLIVWLASTFIPQFTAIAAQYRQIPSSDLTRLSAAAVVLASPLAVTIVLGCLLAAWLLIRQLVRRPSVGLWCERQFYRVPLFGMMRMKTVVATMGRLLGALLFAGVPYDRALALVKDAVPSPIYRRGIDAIRADIRANGGTFSAAAARTGLFEPDFLALIAAGEQSKSAADMLEKIADDYDSDVERDLDAVTALLEPALIAVLGVVVMAVVGIVYGSLYQMMSGIR
jgi:type IV pilus assembly protein PilC